MSGLDYSYILQNIIVFHDKKENPFGYNLHSHTRYEIYCHLSGDANFFIENKIYPLKNKDIIILNDSEIHKASYKPNCIEEWIAITFDPQIIDCFNSDSYNLKNCFINRSNGSKNRVNLSDSQLDNFVKIINNYDNLSNNHDGLSDCLKFISFFELLVFINKTFEESRQTEENSNIPARLIPVLNYIDDNLESNLKLDFLSVMFHTDKTYLSRIFKKSIGINIGDYILQKRISKAKYYLSNNFSVTSVAELCGFNDYANFLRTFKNLTGISPGKFKIETRMQK